MPSGHGFENAEDREKQAREREDLIASTAKRVAPVIPMVDEVMSEFASARHSKLVKDLMKDGVAWEIFWSSRTDPGWRVDIGYASEDPIISVSVNHYWFNEEDLTLGAVLHRETGLRVEMASKVRFDEVGGAVLGERKTFG